MGCWLSFPPSQVFLGARKRFSLFRIFFLGRFHQLVVFVIFTNTRNDSGCHWTSSLYNFNQIEKDETHGLHSTDCTHCSGGWAVESHRVETSSRWRLRALRRLRSDSAALGGWQRPHRRCGAARRGRRCGCCEQLGPGAPETAGGVDRGWSAGMMWCRVSERTTSVTSCLMILNASCAQSCGRTIGGICCRWDGVLWIFSNAIVRYLASDNTWGDKATEHSGIHWHFWGAPSLQGYNTNCPHAMSTFDKTFSAWRW